MMLAWAAALLLLGVPAFAAGDVLELKDGSLLRGTYAGGTATTLRFETDKGIQVIERAKALALTFGESGPGAAPPTAPPPSAQPSPGAAPAQPAPRNVTVPAGTLLLVKMGTQVTSKDSPGTRFQAQLQVDLLAGDVVAAKAGTRVFGRVDASKQAGRLAGKSMLQLSLSELDLGGKALPIVTSNFSEAGKGSFSKAARNAAVGAGIGALVDGEDGAKTGAAVGLTASVLRQGDTIVVPPNALLEFRLTQPVQITVQ